jgi:two-component system chemotaxis sensor kinase CheA
MDVVRRNLERLRGKIEIRSETGKGVTFSIFLPLTLAIIDGLIVGVDGHRFILPTIAVQECFQPTPGMIATVQARGEVINVRGRWIPLMRLHRFLDLPAPPADAGQGIVLRLEAGCESRCVLVDQLLGKQEVVIKGLGETFSRQPAYAGATILGDGLAALILDPNVLVKGKGVRREG